MNSQIRAIIGESNELSEDMIKKLVTDVLGLPIYFSILLTLRANNKPDIRTMKKMEFLDVWK